MTHFKIKKNVKNRQKLHDLQAKIRQKIPNLWKLFNLLFLVRAKQEDNHFVLSFTLECNSRVNDNTDFDSTKLWGSEILRNSNTNGSFSASKGVEIHHALRGELKAVGV